VGWFPLAPGEVFIPGYRVSRGYVNRVNVTNTTVNVMRITSVYNTVMVNRSTTVNNITYANRGVSGGVTVVSRDTFVNARPVGRNVVQVPGRELAAAPVSQMVAAEPARRSELGAGMPAAKRPPAAVMNRQVVALRNPAPMPRSFEQRQAQAGGHLNQPLATGPALNQQSLVRQEPSGTPVITNQESRPAQSQDGFRPFGQASAGNGQTKPQPHVWEEQGTPEPEKSPETQTESGNAQPSGSSRPVQQSGQQRAQWSHPLAKPVAPVQRRNDEQQKDQEEKYSSWHQQKPATSLPQRQQGSQPPAQSHESAPKKER
jgi:hypothetical protein